MKFDTCKGSEIVDYVATNGTEYLITDKQGHRVTNNLEQATIFSSISKVENVLSSLSKKLRAYDLKPMIIVVSNNEIKIFDKDIIINMSDDVINDKITEMFHFTNILEERLVCLGRLLSEVDLEICDIEHAAEFFTLNASQGYKIYKLLHDARVKRRKLKNEADKIKWTLSTKLNPSSLKSTETKIANQQNRNYRPRVIKELFNV